MNKIFPETTLLSQNLKVAPTKDAVSIFKALNHWSIRASKVIEFAQNDIPSPILQRMHDCLQMCQEITSLLKSTAGNKNLKTLVCYNPNERIIQALACILIKPNSIYLTKMVTAPRNILAITDQDKNRSVRGAGSTLIKKVISFAKRKGLGLNLTSLKSAVGFYRKLGFIEISSSRSDLGLVQMSWKNGSPEDDCKENKNL